MHCDRRLWVREPESFTNLRLPRRHHKSGFKVKDGVLRFQARFPLNVMIMRNCRSFHARKFLLLKRLPANNSAADQEGAQCLLTCILVTERSSFELDILHCC